ncbi:SDR family oxidoreductase [Celerinatantimonas diazotrophica]|uniref:Dihydromonapterin reductase/dihydrofolate reductase n=1 Tax=Celerinatantimonas diazotrophica TaxID=412034 RepID=A0A4R1JN14_9GAMM|nr:SDR family oxidoreductase [Celerinatantimonas diazotrophica]TCK51909.1 dihydromonapterin reductase/dihydrofolate reductase [Celerinatantimonas diazotrophica]CAG9296395.1 Dihydromonapterin reductase [Celerinatantimonas diazotrophica]
MTKHAFITGIGHRLGYYLACQLLEKGYKVSGHYHQERPNIELLRDQGVTLFQADFCQENSVKDFIGELSHIQQLDVLIHNASAFFPNQSDPWQQAEDLTKLVAVHMQVPLLITEVLKQALSNSDNGCIVAMTDIYVHHPNEHYSAYCASKSGLDSLMQSYARLLAPSVRVNCIEPGPILFLPEHSEAYRQQVMQQTLLNCEGGFEPIWQTLQMILQNQFLTGARIAVDGGRSVAKL